MSAERRPETDATRRQVLGAGLAGTGILSLPAFLEPGAGWLRRGRPPGRDGAFWAARSFRRSPGRPRSTRPRVSTATSAVATRSTRGRSQDRRAPRRSLRARWATGFRRRSSRAPRSTAGTATSPSSRQGLHRQQGRPLAARRHERLTVYTTRKHPLTNPTERNLYPQVRDARGGPLRRVSWDEALDRVADAIKRALDARGPSSIGLWGADHLSPEMNFATTKLFFAPAPKGLYNRALGPDAGVAVRAIHNRPKWNSEHPSIEQHFGSNSTLLYSYRDFELADTILLSGANSYVTGTVLYNRMFARPNRKVVIDPRRTVPAANAEDLDGVHLQLKPNTDVVLLNSLMNVILASGDHDQAFISQRCDRASFEQLRATVSQAKYTPGEHRAGHGRAGRQAAQGGGSAGQAQEDVDPVREGRHLVGHAERGGDELICQPRPAARQHRPARPRVRPPGRPPERLHVRLRLAAPGQGRRPAQPLAGAGGARSTS